MRIRSNRAKTLRVCLRSSRLLTHSAEHFQNKKYLNACPATASDTSCRKPEFAKSCGRVHAIGIKRPCRQDRFRFPARELLTFIKSRFSDRWLIRKKQPCRRLNNNFCPYRKAGSAAAASQAAPHKPLMACVYRRTGMRSRTCKRGAQKKASIKAGCDANPGCRFTIPPVKYSPP